MFSVEEPGFWALTRRADIVYVSQHPELFTRCGVALNPMPAEIQRFKSLFLTTDPLQHTVYRRLISSAFAVRAVRHRGHRDQRSPGRGRRQGRAVLLLGEPGRDRLRRCSRIRPHPFTQPAPGVRRRRSALLPRQSAGKEELRNLLHELLSRLKTIGFGEPDVLYSSFLRGVKRLPAVVR